MLWVNCVKNDRLLSDIRPKPIPQGQKAFDFEDLSAGRVRAHEFMIDGFFGNRELRSADDVEGCAPLRGGSRDASL